MTRHCPDCEQWRVPRELPQSGRAYCPRCGLVLDDGGRADPLPVAQTRLSYSALGGGS